MHKNLIKVSLFGIVISILFSCASPYTLHLHLVNPDISVKGRAAIFVSSIDQREYVLSGKSDPRYIATTRGGFGNTLNIFTNSKKPVSDDITGIFKAALLKNGYSVETISTVTSADKNGTLNKMKSNSYDKYILICIKELRLDIAMTGWTSYFFKFEIDIYDKNMKLIGSNSHKFEDSLGTVFVIHQAFDRMVERIKIDIELLMNNEKIKNALK